MGERFAWYFSWAIISLGAVEVIILSAITYKILTVGW